MALNNEDFERMGFKGHYDPVNGTDWEMVGVNGIRLQAFTDLEGNVIEDGFNITSMAADDCTEEASVIVPTPANIYKLMDLCKLMGLK